MPLRPILHHHKISRFFDFQDGDRPPVWIFKIEILTAVHFRDTFCLSLPNFMDIGHTIAETSQFLRCSIVKCTRSSAIADGTRDAACQLKSCQLPRSSAETTYTTSPDQIDGMKLEI